MGTACCGMESIVTAGDGQSAGVYVLSTPPQKVDHMAIVEP